MAIKLKQGDIIVFDVPLWGIRPEPDFPVGTEGRIGKHPDERYENLIAWLPDGSWADPYRFEPDEWHRKEGG